MRALGTGIVALHDRSATWGVRLVWHCTPPARPVHARRLTAVDAPTRCGLCRDAVHRMYLPWCMDAPAPVAPFAFRGLVCSLCVQCEREIYRLSVGCAHIVRAPRRETESDDTRPQRPAPTPAEAPTPADRGPDRAESEKKCERTHSKKSDYFVERGPFLHSIRGTHKNSNTVELHAPSGYMYGRRSLDIHRTPRTLRGDA